MAKRIKLTTHSSEFFRTMGHFIETRDIAPSTVNNYLVLAGALMRFEQQRPESLELNLNSFSATDIDCFLEFYRNEPACGHRRSKIRSHNTVCSIMRCLRTFFNWCQRREIISSNPFDQFGTKMIERYASPFFLTPDERDSIACYNLSADPLLAAQRDVFIFQCFVGCRVSDLTNLRTDNIVNGNLEYIAHKTAADNPVTISVPLHPCAIEIIQRYSRKKLNGKLLPFIDHQRYNYAIKHILTVCGITRPVSLLCPYTGNPIRRPINEVATSHMARRTFIGNLYRKTKDPSIISSLTGHAEGSRAFNRYRTIDDDIKREIIMLL